jgi:hypothetical protein
MSYVLLESQERCRRILCPHFGYSQGVGSIAVPQVQSPRRTQEINYETWLGLIIMLFPVPPGRTTGGFVVLVDVDIGDGNWALMYLINHHDGR